MCPTCVGSGDATLMIAAHTAGDTSQSAPQNLSVTSTVSSSAFGSSQLTTGGDTMQKEAQSEVRRAREAPLVFSAGEDPAQHNQQNSGVPKKKPITLSSKYSRIQTPS